MKKIILISAFVVLGFLVLGQAVYAANSTLSVLPASLDSAVGKVFNVFVQMDPAGNKICVVKGALSFDNLSCQSITVSNAVMAQTAPTCANPSFLLGIPKCVITDQNILSVSVKGDNAGTGRVSLSGVKIIGIGTDVSSNLQNGAYNITEIQTQTPAPQPAPKVAQTAPQIVSQAVPKTVAETTPEVSQPDNQISQQEVQPAKKEAETQTAALASAPIVKFFSSPIVIIILAIIIFLVGIWVFKRFVQKNKN